MVFATFAETIDITNLVTKLKNKNILVSTANPMRLVTHLDISQTDIDCFIQQLTNVLNANTKA